MIGAQISFEVQTVGGGVQSYADYERGRFEEPDNVLRLVLELPRSAMMGLGWSMQIYAALDKDGVQLTDQWTSDESEQGGPYFVPESRDSDTDGGLQRMILTRTLPVGQAASSAYAKVRVSLRQLDGDIYTNKYSPFIDEKLTA